MQPTDSDFMRELMTVFCAEARERLATIDQRLLAIEQSGDPSVRGELLADLMRELHTLKGSAGAVNLPEVGRLAHALETHFGSRVVGDEVAQETYDSGYAALDVMREMIDASARGEMPGVDVDMVMTTLQRDVPEVSSSEPRLVDDAGAEAAVASQELTDTARSDAGPQTPSSRNESLQDTDMPTILHGVPGPAHASTALMPPATATAQVEMSPSGAAPAMSRPEAGADDVVRLPTAKLDSLMARVGELVVTRIGAGKRADEVRELGTLVTAWEETWRRVRPQYLKVAEAVKAGDVGAASLLPEMKRLLPALEESDSRLNDLAHQLHELRSGVEADERRLGQVTSDIEDEVRRTRMLPVATLFDPLHRVVRDLARDLGKEVVLEVEGGDTEVDRSVLEQIRGPLTHLVRNAMDHGVERPGVREAAGKHRRATLRLAAAQRGGSLLLAISEDGAGIDPVTIRDTAQRAGTVTNDQLRVMGERDVLRLIFRPGFSTADTVSDLSGRGVGLDVVRETVERLNGMVDVASEIGTGTTFTLSLPLSVATTQALLIEVDGLQFALPIGAVSRIVSVEQRDIGHAQGREMIVLDDGPAVLVRLEDVLQLSSGEETQARRPVIMLGSHEGRLCIAVDRVVGTQDVVVKPLPKPFERVRHAAGATVLASGDVVVVLNTSDLVRSATRTAVRVAPAVMAGHSDIGADVATGPPPRRGRVMVVDDSIVTRMLEKSILEAAGYDVQVAADGQEALRQMRVAAPDLVVSDVNMPNMDGLALTHAIRCESQWQSIPVILVTSLDASDDHARGMEAGADAYIVKSSFSQEGLLQTVGRLLPATRGSDANRSRR